MTDIVERVLNKLEKYEAKIERLRKQLPETMQNCTIQFKECEYGHGRLTATNWIDNGCPTCEIERLQAALVRIQNWYPISVANPRWTIKEIQEFAHAAREAKDA